MRFAQLTYKIAGIYGLIVTLPMFINEPWIAKNAPPPINHPEYYYGFAVLCLAWQLAFLVIAKDPVRFRPLMPVTFVEKFGFVIAIAALYTLGRVGMMMVGAAAVDLLLGIFFVLAYSRTPKVLTP